jgi:two-component system cell cycle sensor histidine kinase/response regulator CckA
MKTILVFEEKPLAMTLLRHLLKQYSLIEATTAERALELFADHAHQIDLFITELMPSTSSGLEVALRLRSEAPSLPVILMSSYPVGYWSDWDSVHLQKLGLSSVVFLQKPIQPQVLSKTVRELVGAPQCEQTKTALLQFN